MIDALWMFRKYCYLIYNGMDFHISVIRHVSNLIKLFEPEKIIFLIDEKEYVPKCKQSTWDIRGKKKVKPYSVEEINTLNLSITDGKLPELERVYSSPLLMEDLICYFYGIIKKMHLSADIGCTIVIDGAVRSSRLKRKRREKKYDIEEPAKAGVTYFQQGVPKPVHMDSFRIGEADLKVVKHIGLNMNKNILVLSSDSDNIPILLLNARDWIDIETGNIKPNVYVDFGEKSVVGLRFLSITSLYRCIGKYMIPLKIERPIETLCIIIIITGTDYVESQYNIGPSTIWSEFNRNGYHIFKRGLEDSVFKSDEEIGDPSLRHPVNVAEYLLKRFIDPLMRGSISSKQAKNEKAKKEGKFITPTLSLDSCFRRVWWQLDYWINGSKVLVLDPISTRNTHIIEILDGRPIEKTIPISINGWIFDTQLKKVVPAKEVWKFGNKRIR
jgi:hypothetical protein